MAFLDGLLDGNETGDKAVAEARSAAGLGLVMVFVMAGLVFVMMVLAAWFTWQGAEAPHLDRFFVMLMFTLVLALLMRERYRRIRLEQRLATI